MTPQFAKAVDPIFEFVLVLLDRIDTGEGAAIDAEREKDRIIRLLDEAQAKLGESNEWQLAKYGLICWIDEVLIAADWPGSTWWNEYSLESSMFNQRERNEQFYVWARSASELTRRDALEVFYIAVILGFRGFYADPPQRSQLIAGKYQLPPQLETWVKRTADAIKQTGRPPIKTTGKLGPGAPPLKGRSTLVAAVLSSAVLLAILSILMFQYFEPL
ncbi:MAG: DotU family type IV/VI secretion system protein [Pirellulales bacterium]